MISAGLINELISGSEFIWNEAQIIPSLLFRQSWMHELNWRPLVLGQGQVWPVCVVPQCICASVDYVQIFTESLVVIRHIQIHWCFPIAPSPAFSLSLFSLPAAVQKSLKVHAAATIHAQHYTHDRDARDVRGPIKPRHVYRLYSQSCPAPVATNTGSSDLAGKK